MIEELQKFTPLDWMGVVIAPAVIILVLMFMIYEIGKSIR